MNILENIRFALSALWVNKIRSLLTILGVIIGVSAVVSLIAVGEGVRNEFSSQIESLGTNLVVIVPGDVDLESFNPTQAIGVNTLTLKDVDAVKEEVEEVENAAPLMLISGSAVYQKTAAKQSIIFGTTEEIEKISNLEINKGRFLEESDLKEKRKVAVLGSQINNTLFPDAESVGNNIKILGEDFEVIGSLKYDQNALQMGGVNLNDMIDVPLTTARAITNNLQIFRILIKINDPENINTAVEKVKQVVLEKHGGEKDFTVFTQEDMLSMFDSIFGILTKAIVGIAAISLIVGGIGIMNIMLVSITERTREIGIRKALGASSGSVMFQFLVESSILSLFGGFLGLLLAYGSTFLVTKYADIPTLITPQALILAFGVSVGVGIIFGIMPASKAARKNPIDALRYE